MPHSDHQSNPPSSSFNGQLQTSREAQSQAQGPARNTSAGLEPFGHAPSAGRGNSFGDPTQAATPRSARYDGPGHEGSPQHGAHHSFNQDGSHYSGSQQENPRGLQQHGSGLNASYDQSRSPYQNSPVYTPGPNSTSNDHYQNQAQHHPTHADQHAPHPNQHNQGHSQQYAATRRATATDQESYGASRSNLHTGTRNGATQSTEQHPDDYGINQFLAQHPDQDPWSTWVKRT